MTLGYGGVRDGGGPNGCSEVLSPSKGWSQSGWRPGVPGVPGVGASVWIGMVPR